MYVCLRFWVSDKRMLCCCQILAKMLQLVFDTMILELYDKGVKAATCKRHSVVIVPLFWLGSLARSFLLVILRSS